jgi:hypothetical protein
MAGQVVGPRKRAGALITLERLFAAVCAPMAVQVDLSEHGRAHVALEGLLTGMRAHVYDQSLRARKFFAAFTAVFSDGLLYARHC